MNRLEPDESRYEMKLVCAASRLAEARQWIRLHPEALRATYAPRQVNSLYLDTSDLASMNANLAGIKRRQKIRLRWYGPLTQTAVRPELELKFKEDLRGAKARHTLACELNWERPYALLLQTIYQSAPPAWRPYLQVASRPTLILHYQRQYFASPDGLLRVTLDYDQVGYDQRPYARPNIRHKLPLPPLIVIEIKAPLDQSERLETAMSHFPLRRNRNSKYVNGVLAGIL